MADVMNERFTICLNAHGDPVRRRLSDMTPGEVMEAIIWNSKEADRLEQLAAPFKDRGSDPYQAFEAGELTGLEAAAQFEHSATILKASAVAMQRSALLELAVFDALPLSEHEKTTMPVIEALRRYWPGGRHRRPVE
jgi:hypothetical protein